MRLERDRRHLVPPVIGKLRSKENTRRLERFVAKGRARVLSMTLAEQGGRLFVSIVQAIVAHQPPHPGRGEREPERRVPHAVQSLSSRHGPCEHVFDVPP
jgi:hypothetical protein